MPFFEREGRQELHEAQQRFNIKNTELEAIKTEIESGGGDALEATRRYHAVNDELRPLYDEAMLLQQTTVPVLRKNRDTAELNVQLAQLDVRAGDNNIMSNDEASYAAAALERQLREPVKEALRAAKASDSEHSSFTRDLDRARNKGLWQNTLGSPLQASNSSGSMIESFSYNGEAYGGNAVTTLDFAIRRLFRNAEADLRAEREAEHQRALEAESTDEQDEEN